MNSKRTFWGIVVGVFILSLAGSFGLNLGSISISAISQRLPFQIPTTLLGSGLNILISLIPPVLAWKRLDIHQQRLEIEKKRLRAEQKEKRPDIHIEEWFPTKDKIEISLTNLSGKRAKDLGITVLVKPYKTPSGPLGGPTVSEFSPEIECKENLSRSNSRIGKRPANYLQKESIDKTFVASAKAQIVDGIGDLEDGECMPFSIAIDKLLENGVKTLLLQVVLTYSDYSGEEMEPIRVWTFNAGIDFPDHFKKEENMAGSEKVAGGKVTFEKFEDVFYSPTKGFHPVGEKIAPSIGALFTTTSPETLKEIREENNSESD